ncbi:hypothetical protein AVEN_143680-1 [Araneus ventricosus]|uniref:Uncharacterized protein n=1 Tax=Araneus ventricosus TaxID=182803 RepID=A0A4Y2ANA4_ARAVE|nr:hypothetical protein AVEN_143680-1 [Araneus ventricosus]
MSLSFFVPRRCWKCDASLTLLETLVIFGLSRLCGDLKQYLDVTTDQAFRRSSEQVRPTVDHMSRYAVTNTTIGMDDAATAKKDESRERPVRHRKAVATRTAER